MQFSTRRTNFYTPLLFISFDSWSNTLHLTEIRTLHSIYSLGAFQQSPRQTQPRLLNFVYASVIIGRNKEAFVGVGNGDRSTSSPGSFVHHALWKKWVGRQHTTSTSSQNGLLALWNVQGIAAKEGLTFFSLPSKCLLDLNNSKIFQFSPWNAMISCNVLSRWAWPISLVFSDPNFMGKWIAAQNEATWTMENCIVT